MKVNGIELSGAELQRFLDKCWTINDMVEVFRVTSMTIFNWRKMRSLPTVEIQGDGRPALRFMPNEVTAWARKNGIKMHTTNPGQQRVA